MRNRCTRYQKTDREGVSWFRCWLREEIRTWAVAAILIVLCAAPKLICW